MVRIKRKEVRLANRGVLKKGFAGAWREGVSPADGAGLSPTGGRPTAPRRCQFHSISLRNAPAFTEMEDLGVLGPPERVALWTARFRVVASRCGNATMLRGCLGMATIGGFSERKSLLKIRFGDIARPRVGAAKCVSVGQGGGTAMVGWVRRRQMAAGPPSSPAGSKAAAAPQSGTHCHGGRAPTSDQAGPHSPLTEMPSWVFLHHPISSAAALLLPPPPWPHTFSCQEMRWVGGRC